MTEQAKATETVAEPKAEGATPEATPQEQTASKPAETVEELKVAIEKLEKANKEANKEAANRRKRLEELEKAETERQDAAKSELQKATERAEKAEAAAKAASLAVMRRDAAAKVKLPDAFADRLVGATPEELEADAQKLLAALPNAPKAQPKTDPANPGGSRPIGTAEQWEAFLNGGGELPTPKG